MGLSCMDRTGRFRRGVEDALKQFLWYAFQTAIVLGIIAFDASRPDPNPGAAIILGVGWAIAATVVIHLFAEWFRRLWRWFVPLPHEVRERRDDSRRVVPHGVSGGAREQPVGHVTASRPGHPQLPSATDGRSRP
jgi:hypothetical protein